MRPSELLKQEEELASIEAELVTQEGALAKREKESEDALTRARDRLADLEEKLRALAKAGSAEADAFSRNLPELPPGPGVGDRNKAIAARREALNARHAALSSRERAAGLVQAGASRVDGVLNGAVAEANRIESEFAAKKRQEALTRKAAQPPPPPARTVSSPALAAVSTPVQAPSGPPRLDRVPPAPPKIQPAAPAQVGRLAAPKAAGAEANRRQSRIRIDADVSFESESNFFAGFARNLSEGGLFVAAWDFLPVGTELDVAFTVPGGQRVEARAVVRWVREINDATPDVWPGMGLQFLNLPPGADAAITRYMAEREPLFFTE